MNLKRIAFIALFSLILLWAVYALAAETQPGNACATAGLIQQTGGPEQIPARLLICDGANWQTLAEQGTDGRMLVQFGNDTGTCTAAKTGRLKFVGGSTPWYYCDGSVWLPFESAGIVPAYTTFTASKIFIGPQTSIALTSGGNLYGWGYNAFGQVGDGTTTSRTIPTAAAVAFAGPWASLSVAYYHNCGIKTDGTGWCWGGNQTGQLGDGTTTSRISSPVQVAGTWTQIAGGGYVSSSLGGILQPASYWSCGVKSDSTGWCWGANEHGQLGDGTTTQRTSPVQVSGAWSMIVPAGMYGYHTCGIKTDATLWCWGYNGYGQLGDGTTTDRTSPVRVSGAWSPIPTAYISRCGIKTDGTLWCWGYNGQGQLGDGTTTQRTSPVQVSGGGTWSKLSMTYFTPCALKTDGTGWCWGNNHSGQAGNTTPNDQVKVPTQVASSAAYTGSSWIDIGTASSSSCGIRDDSTVYCWGANIYGRMGDPYFGRIIPVGAP